jgi:hypothetical protein
MGYSSFDDVQPEPKTWEPYYTYLPHRVNGKWYWFRYIWRKQVLVYGDQHYEAHGYIYGDDFDVLKEYK